MLILDTGATSMKLSPAAGGGLNPFQHLGGPFVFPKEAAPLELRVVVDRALVEAFAGGRASVTGFAPRLAQDYEHAATGWALFCDCPGVQGNATVWELASAKVHRPHDAQAG